MEPPVTGRATDRLAYLRLIVAFPVALYVVGVVFTGLAPLTLGIWWGLKENIGLFIAATFFGGIRFAGVASPVALLLAVPTYLVFCARRVTHAAAYAAAGIVIPAVIIPLDYGVAYTFDLEFPFHIRPTLAGLAADLMSWVPAGFVGGLVLWAIDPTTPKAQTTGKVRGSSDVGGWPSRRGRHRQSR